MVNDTFKPGYETSIKSQIILKKFHLSKRNLNDLYVN